MTREEKQKALDALKISAPVIAVTQEEFNNHIQILNQVMDWLEQEPCEDAISRQAVLDAVDKVCRGSVEYRVIYDRCEELIKAIPSAEPSRDMEEIAEVINCDADAETKCKMIFNILTAKPHYFEEQEPKTGHWITEDMFDGDVAYRCSECNELFWIEDGTPKDNGYNFCPKCGKRLVEPQERSDKE